MKEVLVVYYSQTGQLFDILKNVVSTLDTPQINITYHRITPVEPYPFPWNKETFFDVFPESFLQIPCELVQPSDALSNKKYDLVVLGYQVWYLSPSIPINSFLKSEAGKKILHNTPVVTVIGARNMWIQSQEKVKKLLLECKARLVGNIALVDRNSNHISVITIVHWMMGGKKNKKYGVFPKPGVSEKDIKEAVKFGAPIQKALLQDDFANLQPDLLQLGAIVYKPFLSLADKRANLLFSKWANLIVKKGASGDPKRKKWLVLFNYYLLLAIWLIAPIVFIVFLLTYPIMLNKIAREKKYFSSVATYKD
jgi:menaquinone-dependent protoporphyrinogen IX oxidase